MINEKRRSKRYDRSGITITISDGDKTTQCSLEDVSFTGLLVSDIPDVFDIENTQWVGIINIGGVNIKLGLKPVRATKQDNSISLGFKITDTASNWFEWVSATPRGKDIWGYSD